MDKGSEKLSSWIIERSDVFSWSNLVSSCSWAVDVATSLSLGLVDVSVDQWLALHDKETVKREFKCLCQDYDNSMLLFLCCNYVCYWDEEHVVMGAWIFVIWCAELNDRNKMSWNSLHHQDFEHYEKNTSGQVHYANFHYFFLIIINYKCCPFLM